MRSAVLRSAALAALLAAPAAYAQQTVRIPERDTPLALRTTPVFAIGVEEGRDWEMFSGVEQVAFDRNDNLYVLDGGGHRVLVFDRTGKFVRQVGKQGGGPGEFLVPVSLAVLADGTLAVGDLGHRSYSLFGRDGRYLRSVSFGEEWMPMLGGSELAAHPRGGVVSPMRPALGMRMNGGPRVQTIRSLPIVWQSFTAGAKPVRLFDAPSELRTQQSASPGRGGGQRVSFRVSGPPAFSPELNWGVLPGGGLAVSHTAGYTVRVLDANGRLVRYIQKPMRVRKVTEADRERERDRRREALRSGEGMRMVTVGGPGGGGGRAPRPMAPSREQIEEQIREMEFAETIPAIQNLRVDHAGRLWIERTGRVWGEPGPIDLVTAEGRYLGTITGQRLPQAFSPSGRVAYVERDDLGVQRVIVRQLPRL
ncbi:MAG TPA: 6-bladed beta-propeller [Longimicrobiaceae bacterium]|nr:6-bladed beta-propeller [Longimicrobiaceae bacterium]